MIFTGSLGQDLNKSLVSNIPSVIAIEAWALGVGERTISFGFPD
jgi:hypothetical protein